MPSHPKIVPVADVPPDLLKRITAAMADLDQQKAELATDRSEYAREAKENGVHPKALAWCLAALKLGPGDRNLLLACFDSYRAVLKLDAWQSASDPQTALEDVAA